MSSCTQGHLPPKVVFHPRLSPNEGCLPPKVIFQESSSSTEGRLPPKVVFHRGSSSTEGSLPQRVLFHQRSSSTKGHLQPKVVLHQRSSFTYHNTLADLIFGLKIFWTHIRNIRTKPYIEALCCLKIIIFPAIISKACIHAGVLTV